MKSVISYLLSYLSLYRCSVRYAIVLVVVAASAISAAAATNNPNAASSAANAVITISPAAGTYDSSQAVTITTDVPGAKIYYTTDGSTPTASSAECKGCSIAVSDGQTIQVIAVKAGTTSGVASATYNIGTSTADPPSVISSGQIWYVNGGGGTRYSINNIYGQCNGMSPAPYPGAGVDQDCAFNDIRSLWTDGSYTTSTTAGAPAWGWIGSSGDTYLIDCTGGALCRIGQSGPNSGDWYGLAGNPYGAGAPPPISGTAEAHTRILGINYAGCSSPEAKTQVHGGYGVSSVFTLAGASYVDLACFDITDYSSCGRATQTNTCHSSAPLDDYAATGITTSNQTTSVTITDVNIHGMAVDGMRGPTGDGVVVTRVAVSGNASSGWDMDDLSGTTGTGHLTLSYFTTQWSGCAEEYPIVDAVPYQDCTDDNSGGYGDGVGTATVTSSTAWIMSIDHSVAAYNTQDGFDLLHLEGNGSRLTIANTLAYGNMGQQIKAGSASTVTNNVIVGNCNALRQAIPGTPAGYNSRLSDFCRASDVPVVIAVSDGETTQYANNTLYTANTIGVEVAANGACTTSCYLKYENNIFVGFMDNAANGNTNGGTEKLPTPIYFDSGAEILSAAGSSFSNNATFNPRSNWACPNTAWGEVNGICGDPDLVDESWHVYGYGDMRPASNSIVIGEGIPVLGITADYSDSPRSILAPTIGAYEQCKE
ncbi:MAG: chitobiase/beta-hexosaminidase C-terminal domain-containing protein [Acidobacteriaceae bacterium]|nr:chitobiase/beta-hexosaminidase C-terminal domain-containing protein [Acidobacteriaceae bacterium]